MSIYDVDLRDLSSTRHAINRELEKKNDLLLDFTLNIEALELAADGMTAQMSAVDVLRAVYDKKELSYLAIGEAKKKAQAMIPTGIIKRADMFMGSVGMAAIKTRMNEDAKYS